MMKQIVKGLLAVAVCSTLLLLNACGMNGYGLQGGNTALGRYVETKLALPVMAVEALFALPVAVGGTEFTPLVVEEEMWVRDMYLQPDGSLNLMTYENESKAPLILNTTDLINWQPVETPWYQNLPKENLDSMVYDSNGVLYVTTIDDDIVDGEYKFWDYALYRTSMDGNLEQIPVDWYHPSGDRAVMGYRDFKVLANGDFLFEQSMDQVIIQYGSDGAFKGVYDTGSFLPVPFAVSGNQLAILDQGSVRIYDCVSQTLEVEMELEHYTGSSYMYYGQNGALYVQNSSGLYRLSQGGSIWEKIIDGELNSMSLPGLECVWMVELENGDFCMLAGSSRNGTLLLRYRYDPGVATLPEHELVVFTLAENDIVRRAVIEYQLLHPDTKVNVQLADTDGSVTTSDLLRALNTEMLAGKGPDILILDGMNAESYIRKGILADLSEIVAELSAGGKMVEPVLRTYEKDGLVCALPTRYHLPVMIVEEQVAAEIETLDDLARYAAEHPERGILGDLRGETLLELLLPASAPTWTAADGALDTVQLSAFLEAVQTIMNTGPQPIVYADFGELEFRTSIQYERFHYAYRRSHVYLYNMKGFYDAGFLHPLVKPEENYYPVPNPRTDSIVTYLPGQQAKTYIPATTAGINVNSAKMEMAKDFLRLMLSDTVQHDNGERTGFAVSATAQEAEASVISHDFWKGNSNHYVEEDESLYHEVTSVEMKQEITRLAQGVENPSIIDEYLKTMIIEASKGYLEGEKSLEQAIADVEEATKLYLAE